MLLLVEENSCAAPSLGVVIRKSGNAFSTLLEYLGRVICLFERNCYGGMAQCPFLYAILNITRFTDT
jgi:hypothetical protein